MREACHELTESKVAVVFDFYRRSHIVGCCSQGTMIMSDSLKPRVSLTTIQIREGIGAELFSLCHGITEDGKLGPHEVTELDRWLQRNKSSDLPGIKFLTETLQRILADGRVTRDEQREMLEALQEVLPPEVRRVTRVTSAKVEAPRRPEDPKALEKQLKEEVERDRKRWPEDEFDFMVAGVQFENRFEIVVTSLRVGDRVRLRPEPGNAAGESVISVTLADGRQIGFVPRSDSKEVSECMTEGAPYVAAVQKICTGGGVPVPVVLLAIYGVEQLKDIADLMPDLCTLPSTEKA